MTILSVFVIVVMAVLTILTVRAIRLTTRVRRLERLMLDVDLERRCMKAHREGKSRPFQEYIDELKAGCRNRGEEDAAANR